MVVVGEEEIGGVEDVEHGDHEEGGGEEGLEAYERSHAVVGRRRYSFVHD